MLEEGLESLEAGCKNEKPHQLQFALFASWLWLRQEPFGFLFQPPWPLPAVMYLPIVTDFHPSGTISLNKPFLL